LFKAHWERTGDLDRVEDLKRIASEVGLDAVELGRALEEGRYEAALDASRQDAEGAGINAIPAHIFDRRFLVLGAQPEEVLRQVLARLEEIP
ncbi:MAG TPA: DsbA family protein, partial [Candidatus Dormibacteraeota bacterium]